jgi:hypothetical protein
MVKKRPFLSLLQVIHGVGGPERGPFPSLVSFANKVLKAGVVGMGGWGPWAAHWHQLKEEDDKTKLNLT